MNAVFRTSQTLLLMSMLVMVFSTQTVRADPDTTIKAVVLDSWGADHYAFTVYPQLNNEWSTYGSTPIEIDYTSLNKENITYSDIASTEADVLIISHAYPRPEEHVFTDAEILAIRQYLEDGHGIIGTYGSLVSENNRKLAEFFGMNQSIGYIFYRVGNVSTGIFNVLDTSHPLFTALPNPFSVPGAGETIHVPSHDWTIEGSTDGTIVGLTTDNEAAIIVRNTTYKSVYFTNGMEEREGATTERSFQVFYNAIIWAGIPSIAPVRAAIDIDPNTLNLRSRGKWITAYIELPDDYPIGNINVSTIRLNDEVRAKSHPTEIGDHDKDGTPDLMVKFDKAEVWVPVEIGEIALTITGKVNSMRFEGYDLVRVIGN